MRVIETTAYSFAELSPESQETAIENWRDHIASWDMDSNDIDMLTDADYWQDEKLSPLGITIRTHSVSLMNGKSRQEPSVYWQAHYYRDLHFPASVDVPAYMRSRKMAGKYRALYYAACQGDVNAEIAERSGYHSNVTPCRVETEYTGPDDDGIWTTGPDGWGRWQPGVRAARILEQLEILESDIEDFYSQIRHEWLDSIEKEIEYRSSDEYIREELSEYCDHIEFTAEGEIL